MRATHNRVRETGAVVDAVCVGEEESAQLHAIAKATGGYVFRPRTVRLALQLAECEPFLSLAERPPRHLRQTRMGGDMQLLSAFPKARFPEDSCDGSNVPERVQDPGWVVQAETLTRWRDWDFLDFVIGGQLLKKLLFRSHRRF